MNALQSFLAFMHKGGFVLWPLLLLSCLSIGITIERALFWGRVSGGAARARVNRLMEALRNGRRDEVMKMCDGNEQPEMMVALRMALDGADDGVAMAAAEIQRHRLERFSVMLSTIITASPMIGILGTVIGIIKSFNVLGAQTQLADPRGVSGGIGEALIATAAGLGLAILGVFFLNLYNEFLEKLKFDLETAATNVEVMVTKARQEGFDTAAFRREIAVDNA